ncbi:HAD family hydrolase [Gracilibacillus alcaliphilus]|uniref:HAD family hydrolase n=1 Tax=Gracilibacillus alcaliphilus TaxID=1401441 RepID=UPI001959AD3A|nr:HAD family hydrolase [Gracilibacillus alcaliphilus]MBM7678862.1 putative hydrolase of the HAD superfamily [Gracilibacillus alcaliphilus]
MKTIIFDVDDTLYDQAQSFHRTFHRHISDNYSYEEIDKVYRASRKYSEQLFDQSEAGEITVYQWQTERFRMACHDFGMEMSTQQAETFDRGYKEEQSNIQLFPEVRQLLDELFQQGKQLAILTNGEEQRQMLKIKQLQLMKWIPDDHIFISGSYGVAKPNKAIFDIVAEGLQCNPEQTIYVGDSYEKDMVGAKQLNWHTVWMNHRHHPATKSVHENVNVEVHHADQLLDYFLARQQA